MLFGFGILATALLLSVVAAYYSVAGLVAIFSAATIPVIIMGGSLELGKLVATVWLHNNWRRAPFLFKAYLVPAVAFLMMLTSMGIFGYLSKAHSDQSLISGDAVAKVAIYDEKIKISKENIDANRRALKQMDESVDQVMGRSTDEKGADKAVALRRSQQKERSRLLAEIEAEQKKITQLNEERAPIAAEFRKVESEVGPIKYIAALVYGENPDANVLERAVRLVIIMIVLVFDPLALTLILAANKQFEWARHGTGGWVHDEPPKSIPESNSTPEPEPEPEESFGDPHPPGWMFDKFPYLTRGGFWDKPEGWESVGPMVAQPEIKLVDPNVEHAYDDERLTTSFDKKIMAVGVDEVERPGDYLVNHEKEAMRLWKAENPADTVKHQRKLYNQGKIDKLPWEDKMVHAETFGNQFPEDPLRGDTHVLTLHYPNSVYKFNGDRWILLDKSNNDSYTYDAAYIDHLIAKIESGEYDPDMLSDNERDQITERLNQNRA